MSGTYLSHRSPVITYMVRFHVPDSSLSVRLLLNKDVAFARISVLKGHARTPLPSPTGLRQASQATAPLFVVLQVSDGAAFLHPPTAPAQLDLSVQDTGSPERTRKRTTHHSLSACAMTRPRCCWTRMPRASCHGPSGERLATPTSTTRTRRCWDLRIPGHRQPRRCPTLTRRRLTGRCVCSLCTAVYS